MPQGQPTEGQESPSTAWNWILGTLALFGTATAGMLVLSPELRTAMSTVAGNGFNAIGALLTGAAATTAPPAR